MHVTDEVVKEGILLDLQLASKQQVVDSMKGKGSLCNSNSETYGV